MQFIRRKRFDYVIIDIEFNGLHDALLLGLGGNHDKEDVLYGIIFLARLEEIDTCHLGHNPITDDDIGMFLL